MQRRFCWDELPIQQCDNLQRKRRRASERKLRLRGRIRGGELQPVRGELLQLSDLHVLQCGDDVQRSRDVRCSGDVRLQCGFVRTELLRLPLRRIVCRGGGDSDTVRTRDNCGRCGGGNLLAVRGRVVRKRKRGHELRGLQRGDLLERRTKRLRKLRGWEFRTRCGRECLRRVSGWNFRGNRRRARMRTVFARNRSGGGASRVYRVCGRHLRKRARRRKL